MENVWLVTGLGNPGKQYDGTRHNVGFETLDELIDTWKIDGPTRFGKSMIGKGRILGTPNHGSETFLFSSLFISESNLYDAKVKRQKSMPCSHERTFLSFGRPT